jgi:uncharacterized protein YcbK (DUF882 family)
MVELKHFKISEFDSPDEPGSGEKMKDCLLSKLDKARDIADIPFIITSGYRTKKHNDEVGGSPTSSHLYGWAVDIAVVDGLSRITIVKSLLDVGFVRIGIGRTFVHVDCDPNKQKSMWVY